MGFSQFFTGIVTILGTLVFMLGIHIQIALVVILITPVSLFVASFIAKRTYTMFQKQSETRAEMTSLVEEMIGNQKTVQAFGYGEEALKRFDCNQSELADMQSQSNPFFLPSQIQAHGLSMDSCMRELGLPAQSLRCEERFLSDSCPVF